MSVEADWKNRYYLLLEENRKLRKDNEQLSSEVLRIAGRLKDRENRISELKIQFEKAKKQCQCNLQNSTYYTRDNSLFSQKEMNYSSIGENVSESCSNQHQAPYSIQKNPNHHHLERQTFSQMRTKKKCKLTFDKFHMITVEKNCIKQIPVHSTLISQDRSSSFSDTKLMSSTDIKEALNNYTFSVLYDFSKPIIEEQGTPNNKNYKHQVISTIKHLQNANKNHNESNDEVESCSDGSLNDILNDRDFACESYDSTKIKILPNFKKPFVDQPKQEEEQKVENLIQSPFKMSKKSYKPNVNEELQKSLFGVSMKDLLERKETVRKNTKSISVEQLKEENEKLFEEFFIIGIEPYKLTSAQLKKEEPLEPVNLYMYNHKVENVTCQRRQVVKDFCFPNGVQISKLTSSERAKKILYGQQASCRENSFIFTLQAQDMDQFDQNEETQLYYCICLVIEELISDDQGENYITQKALCIMSKHQHFEFHLNVLSSIINIYKLERFNIFQQMTYDITFDQTQNQLLKEMQAMMLVPLVNEEIEQFLKCFYNIQPRDKKYILTSPISYGYIQYTVPLNKRQAELNKLLWLAPMFLSCIQHEQFFKILVAILLEKSIVFVSDNLPLLSSAVLGMQCFLLPFKWCHVQIPILPKSLLEMIEAPMPIMVGLLKSHLEFAPNLDEQFQDDMGQQRLVVYINDYTKGVRLNDNQINLPLPDFKGLCSKLKNPFKILNSCSHYIYIPNDLQKNALIEIYDLVTSSLKEFIINNLPGNVQTGMRKEKDYKVLVDHIYNQARNIDKQFTEQFKNTQMLTHFLELNYCVI